MTAASHHCQNFISAPPQCCAENVLVLPIVVAELELGNVQRQVFGADLVVAAHDAALEQAPEAFDGVGVNRADDVFASGVIHDAMRELAVERIVAAILVGAEQADFVRHGSANEADQCFAVDLADHASDHVALAAHCADHRNLSDRATPASRTRTAGAATVALVPILRLAADEGFVNFHNAHQLIEIFVRHAATDAMAHAPRGLVRAETEQAEYLQGADSLLACQHQVDNLKPLAQRLVRILEDRPDRHAKAVAGRIGAGVADPIELAGAVFYDINAATARAAHASRPALRDKVAFARIVVRKRLLELANRELMDAGMFDLCHCRVSVDALEHSLGAIS